MHSFPTRRRAACAGYLALALACALCTTDARAQGKRATAQSAQARGEALYKESAEAYRQGDFQRAVSLLVEAYGLDPQPVLLYNLARAYESLGNIDGAIDTYTRYIEADPKAADRGAIEQRVATLKRQREERLALEKQRDDERTRADREKAERQRQPDTTKPPHERSVLPYVVAGVGVAAVATGVVFGVLASSKHDNASTLSTPQQTAIDQQDSAKSLATLSTVSFIVGGALVAAGATWWVIDGKSAGKPASGAAQPLRIGLAPGFIMLERGLP